MYKIEDVKNTILKGDVVEQLKLLPTGGVDTIFADPPYFMGVQGNLFRSEGTQVSCCTDEWDKFESKEAYETFCVAWLREAWRVLKENGTIWVTGSFQNIYEVGYLMRKLGFYILNDVIWHKSNPMPNFKGVRLTNSHETLLWCSKGAESKYTYNYKLMKTLNGDRQLGSVWNIPLCTGAERLKDSEGNKLHTTQKPEKLLENVILASTSMGDTVLDCFFGTGTTGAVAKRLGRNWVGIEREERYIQGAQERIDKVLVEPNIVELGLVDAIPKVPLATLITKGYIRAGSDVYTSEYVHVGTLTEEGCIQGQFECLPFHEMAKRIRGKANANGWLCFCVQGEDGRLRCLDEYRRQYGKEDDNA